MKSTEIKAQILRPMKYTDPNYNPTKAWHGGPSCVGPETILLHHAQQQQQQRKIGGWYMGRSGAAQGNWKYSACFCSDLTWSLTPSLSEWLQNGGDKGNKKNEPEHACAQHPSWPMLDNLRNRWYLNSKLNWNTVDSAFRPTETFNSFSKTSLTSTVT